MNAIIPINKYIIFMRRIYLTAVAVACMCTLHAEQTQTGNYVLSNSSVNIVDFCSPIAAADEVLRRKGWSNKGSFCDRR